MQYKSYIVEEDIDVIKESLVLFYGKIQDFKMISKFNKKRTKIQKFYILHKMNY